MSVHDNGLHLTGDRVTIGALLQGPDIDVAATQGGHSYPAASTTAASLIALRAGMPRSLG